MAILTAAVVIMMTIFTVPAFGDSPGNSKVGLNNNETAPTYIYNDTKTVDTDFISQAPDQRTVHLRLPNGTET